MIELMTAISITLFITSFYALWRVSHFLRRMRDFERRLTQMEMHVVRSVMDENPKIAEEIVKTARSLHGMLDGYSALRAARRLFGLEP